MFTSLITLLRPFTPLQSTNFHYLILYLYKFALPSYGHLLYVLICSQDPDATGKVSTYSPCPDAAVTRLPNP